MELGLDSDLGKIHNFMETKTGLIEGGGSIVQWLYLRLQSQIPSCPGFDSKRFQIFLIKNDVAEVHQFRSTNYRVDGEKKLNIHS